MGFEATFFYPSRGSGRPQKSILKVDFLYRYNIALEPTAKNINENKNL